MTKEQALAVLKKKLEGKRDNLISYLRIINRATPGELETFGYRGKTNGEVMQLVFAKFDSDMLKMIEEFERKHH